MKTLPVFVPVLFIVMLFIVVLPRLSKAYSVSTQILPSTSITPAVLPEPRVSVRPVMASQPAQESSQLPVFSAAGVEAAAPESLDFSGLSDFAAPYLNGRADQVVAVSVNGRFSLPVTQQPEEQPAFVSSEADLLTQFALPRQYGTTGLLAHNFLSGKLFFDLQMGDIVAVVYGDGTTEQFQVNRIESFQALSPNSPYSQFVNLDDAAETILSSANLFNRIYTQPGQVVFQTCIAVNGEPSWGRLFVTASRFSISSDIPTPDQFINNN